MAWLRCCCVCCVLSPVLLPFVLRFCSFTPYPHHRGPGAWRKAEWSAESQVSSREESVIFNLLVSHTSHCKPSATAMQLQSCGPVGLWAWGMLVVISFLRVRSCSGRWRWMRSVRHSRSLIVLVCVLRVRRSWSWLRCPEEKSRFFSTCSIHLQAIATSSHLQLQSCGHVGGDPFSACALLLRPLDLDEIR